VAVVAALPWAHGSWSDGDGDREAATATATATATANARSDGYRPVASGTAIAIVQIAIGRARGCPLDPAISSDE
jgi:hypothetical protein